MSETKNDKINTERRTKASFKVSKVLPFNGDMKTNLLTSIEMCDRISALFGSVFSDYDGCNIRINNGTAPGVAPIILDTIPLGSIYVDIAFKDKPKREGDERFKSIHLRGTDTKAPEENNLAQKYFAINAMIAPNASGRIYDVDRETYEALEEFMPYTNVRWAAHTQEIATSIGVYGNKEEAVVYITGLSLEKILAKMYGNVDDNGNAIDYSAIPANRIPTSSSEFIIQVSRLNMQVVSKLQRELGMGGYVTTGYHKYNL